MREAAGCCFKMNSDPSNKTSISLIIHIRPPPFPSIDVSIWQWCLTRLMLIDAIIKSTVQCYIEHFCPVTEVAKMIQSYWFLSTLKMTHFNMHIKIVLSPMLDQN